MSIFNTAFLDMEGILELLIRFGFNLLAIILIIRLLYYRKIRRKDYFFTYILISTIIFLLCYLLENVKLQLGFALGLFAIFGILRYRTRQIPIKEMTYLFVVIGLTVINALANQQESYIEIILPDALVFLVIFILEKLLILRNEEQKVIEYEKIELILPEKRDEMIVDLEKRTGLKINRIEVGSINFLHDTAKIVIYYTRNNSDEKQSGKP